MNNQIPKITFILGLIAILLLFAAPLGTRFGFYSFFKAFMLLRICVFVGLATIIVALVSMIFIRNYIGFTVLGLLLGLIAAGIILNNFRIGKSLPRINDITTDIKNPPLYVAIIPLRKNAMNKIEYGGPEYAKKQEAGYPDIKTIYSKLNKEDAFLKAFSIAKSLGWEMIADNLDAGRIEAVATSFWYGFKDDIVIRIQAEKNGSKIDIRSKSRVGRGDFGVNAKRIRKFIKEFNS